MFNFAVNQLNSAFDDSAFFIRNVYRRKGFLLDCGRLGGLEHSEILSLDNIFVTHTHMDHFYGFDRILRGSLRADHRLNVYGPPGFIDNVDGKFRGYTWNLVEDYGFSVRAVELSPDGEHREALFEAKNKFVPTINNLSKEYLSTALSKNIQMPSLDLGEGFNLNYEFFDHRTLCMGYRISEPLHYTVDKERLREFGHKPGAWLSELKNALSDGQADKKICVDNQKWLAGELRDRLITERPPQIITYITDCAPTEENIEKAVEFASGSTLLIIEAVFLNEDKDHAIQKNHLTLGLAKKIFFESNSQYVRFTHFAARYETDKTNFMAQLYAGMNGRVYTKNNR